MGQEIIVVNKISEGPGIAHSQNMGQVRYSPSLESTSPVWPRDLGVKLVTAAFAPGGPCIAKDTAGDVKFLFPSVLSAFIYLSIFL